MASWAAPHFAKARWALAPGDFASAVKHARVAEALVGSDVHITDYGAPPNPIYYIIVLLYHRHADLRQALSRLVRYSDRDFLVFIDDDGFIEEHAIEHLIETITTHNAVAVRGRVYPKSPGGVIISDYDLGDEIVYSAQSRRHLHVAAPRISQLRGL